MSVFQWPYIREHYDGIDNPIYDQDIQVAMEAVLAAAMVLTGMGPNDFAILSGMDFDGSTNYTAGYFVLNGTIYYMPNAFTSGQALGPVISTILDENFNEDGQSRSIYDGQYAQVVGQGAGTTPAFAGDMNTYRVGGKRLMQAVNGLLVTAAALGSAAFLNVGSGPNTVMAGNDPRAPYTAAQLDTRYAQILNVIIKGAGTVYTPTGPWDPVNKNYVDTAAIVKLAEGVTNVGDIPTGGVAINISFGTTLPDTNYLFVPVLLSQGTIANDGTLAQIPVGNKSQTGCTVYLRELVGTTQNVAIEWIVLKK